MPGRQLLMPFPVTATSHTLADYCARGGYATLARVVAGMPQEEIVKTVTTAGLLGHGQVRELLVQVEATPDLSLRLLEEPFRRVGVGAEQHAEAGLARREIAIGDRRLLRVHVQRVLAGGCAPRYSWPT